jgi:hypothetical protein
MRQKETSRTTTRTRANPDPAAHCLVRSLVYTWGLRAPRPREVFFTSEHLGGRGDNVLV